MNGEQTQPAAPDLPDALRPFHKAGRYRNADVVQQIKHLHNASDYEFWRLAKVRDTQAADYVKNEALVYLLREKLRHGDADTAWKIAELLVERTAGRIYRMVSRWRLISQQHTDDCAQDVQIQMLEQFIDLGNGAEFWEANYTWCLQCLVQNVVHKYRKIAATELYPEPFADDEGHATDRLAQLPDVRSLSAQQRAEILEALALLPDNERIAFVLFHQEGWSQQEIAEHLNVTDRTVRNLLARAAKRLASHYRDA